jgi:hypothetical protein
VRGWRHAAPQRRTRYPHAAALSHRACAMTLPPDQSRRILTRTVDVALGAEEAHAALCSHCNPGAALDRAVHALASKRPYLAGLAMVRQHGAPASRIRPALLRPGKDRRTLNPPPAAANRLHDPTMTALRRVARQPSEWRPQPRRALMRRSARKT